MVIQSMVETVNGRVPVLSGVAERSTRRHALCAGPRAAGRRRVHADARDALQGRSARNLTHFRTAAKATGLPIMIYNNPISYANDITPEMFAELADVKNFVALKE